MKKQRPLNRPWHIRQPISQTSHLIFRTTSVVILIITYLFISHRQHQSNPEDTTVPNLTQLYDGFQTITAGINAPWKKLSNISLIIRIVHGLIIGSVFWFLFRKSIAFFTAFSVFFLFAIGVGDCWLVEDFKATYFRLFVGMTWAIGLSAVVGIAMACFESIEAFCYPALAISSNIPATGAIALFMILAGTGEHLYTSLLVFGVFPTLAKSIFVAAKEGTPINDVYHIYTLGATTSEAVGNLVVPYTIPHIIDAARLAVGPSIVYLIAAEMLVGDIGFGYRMRLQARLLNMNVVMLYLAFLGSSGYLIDLVLQQARDYFCPWHSEKEKSIV